MIEQNLFEPELLLFGHLSVLNDWGNEVKDAVESSANEEDWDLIGHAISIITSNEDDCATMLKSIAGNAGLNFIEMNWKQVLTTFSNSEFSASITKPSLVYLKHGAWMMQLDEYKRLDSDELEFDLVQENICQAVKSFSLEVPVLYVISVNDLDNLSEKFRQADLFDRRFIIQNLTYEEKGRRFIRLVGENICDNSLINNYQRLGKLINLEFKDKRRQELIALALKRLSRRQDRRVTFVDLVDMAMRGSAESDGFPDKTEGQLNQVAIHEAGHAVVAIIDSDGRNIPDYASILEGKDFHGIVVQSYGYLYAKGHDTTYEQFIHRVRIALAGRVAEHLILGYDRIGTSAAEGDLRKAHHLSYRMFAERGIPIDTSTVKAASSNLMVVLDEPSQSHLAHIEKMVREFLSEQYQYVYSVLEKNKTLLNKVADALKKHKILDQSDLIDIIHQDGILVSCPDSLIRRSVSRNIARYAEKQAA